MKYSLAIAQVASTKNVTANYITLERLTLQAKQTSCQALCLPEAFLTGYSLSGLEQQSLTADAAVLQKISRLAKVQGMDLLVGFQERLGQVYYLTQGIFLASGERHFYRKTHLGQREALFFKAGGQLAVYQLSCGLKIGIALCVECHFPELLQTLSLQGAQVVFAPHAVPSKAGSRRIIWSKYIPARSYDNRLYMACCNQWDEQKFAGGCLVTNPEGEELCAYDGEGEKLISFTVDEALLDGYRANSSMSRRYYPAFRRPELYK